MLWWTVYYYRYCFGLFTISSFTFSLEVIKYSLVLQNTFLALMSLNHHSERCLDTICPPYSHTVSTGKSQRALLGELFPPEVSSVVRKNTPAPEHILAK